MTDISFKCFIIKKSVTNYLALSNLLLLSCVLAGTSSVSALADNSDVVAKDTQVEKKEKFLTSRSILSIGATQQEYTGSYRDATKNSFRTGNPKDGYNNVDIDKSYGVNIDYTYELQLNFARFFNQTNRRAIKTSNKYYIN